MTKASFLEAVDIISANHSTKMIINKPVNGNCTHTNQDYRISITDCCQSVIAKLLTEKFRLGMKEGYLEVNKD